MLDQYPRPRTAYRRRPIGAPPMDKIGEQHSGPPNQACSLPFDRVIPRYREVLRSSVGRAPCVADRAGQPVRRGAKLKSVVALVRPLNSAGPAFEFLIPSAVPPSIESSGVRSQK